MNLTTMYCQLYAGLMLASLLCIVCSTHSQAQFFPPIKEKTVTTGIGIYKELDFPRSYQLNANIASEYRIRTWFSFGLEGSLCKFTADDYSNFGAGIRPVTRIYFYGRPKWALFAESKGGVIVMLPQFSGQLNYTFVGSLGAEAQLSQRYRLRISGGYSHFSNGKPKGDVINPTYDGIGFNISLVRVVL